MGGLIVFDLDGTLVDSAADLLATLDAVLGLHGVPACRDPGLRNGIGHGARHLIEYALNHHRISLDDAAVSAIHRDFLVHYEGNIAVRTRVYPGVVEMLDRFAARGWRFAVCSNKFERMSRKLLAELGLVERFAAIGGGDSFANRKPHPGHLLETIAAAGGTPQRAIMVGDSRTDIDTARAAGVPVVGVSFGYSPAPMADLEPDLFLDSFDDFSIEAAEGLLDTARERPGVAARRMATIATRVAPPNPG
jgi:phosphoglycolate phosphatase